MAKMQDLDMQDDFYEINLKQSAELRQKVADWISEGQFTHMLTIRVPSSNRYASMEAAHTNFYRVLKRFEKSLLGKYWYNHMLYFRGFMEKGLTGTWHAHVLLWADKYSTERLQKALETTRKYTRLASDALHLVEITRTPEILSQYCVKELIADDKGHFNPDRIFLSETLFYIPRGAIK